MVHIPRIASDHSLVSVENVDKNVHDVDNVLRVQACPVLRFSLEDTIIYTIPNRDDYTQEEMMAAHYDSAQLSAIKKDARCTGRWLAMNECMIALESSIRGLESVIYYEIGEERRQSRNLGASAVLSVQEKQEQEGVVDELAIALEYSRVSQPAQQRAHKIALQDARAAQEE